jgi:geranylgeranyl pyrophosphate synthase
MNRMDDVEDNSELRRGEPVAHTIYGVPQTINTANYVYFQAIQELLKLQHTSSDKKANGGDEDKGKGKGKEDLIGLVTEELLNLHRGQGLDLFWRDSLVCPTEEEYVHMVLGSTSTSILFFTASFCPFISQILLHEISLEGKGGSMEIYTITPAVAGGMILIIQRLGDYSV